MPIQEFTGELDAPEVAEFSGELDGDEKPPSSWRRVADVGISALKGAIGVPEAAVGLADIVTGGKAGKVAEDAGFRPREAKAFLDEYLSPQQKAANQALAEAEGFLPTVGTALKNPSTILHAAVESLPLMGAGGVAARGLMGAAGLSPMIAGAAGEGIAGAGSAAEQIRQESPDGMLDERGALSAVGSGAGTAVFGAAGGALARKLKIADIDTMIAQGSLTAPAGASGKGFLRKLAEGAISEGVFEELPQSLQEQMWQNYATGKPIMERVAESGAMGMLTGMAMGGPAAALSGSSQPDPNIPPGLTGRDKLLNDTAEFVIKNEREQQARVEPVAPVEPASTEPYDREQGALLAALGRGTATPEDIDFLVRAGFARQNNDGIAILPAGRRRLKSIGTQETQNDEQNELPQAGQASAEAATQEASAPGEAALNPETQSGQPVAESQALAPEASDTGVAPGQAAVLPDPAVPLSPKTVAGAPVAAQTDEQLQALATNPETPATTRHAAATALQARTAQPADAPAPVQREAIVAPAPVEREALEAQPPSQPAQAPVPPSDQATDPLRPLIESLIYRKRFADQLGYGKSLENALARAKSAMAGQPVKLQSFSALAKMVKGKDAETAGILDQIAAQLKMPRNADKPATISDAETARREKLKQKARARKQIDMANDSIITAIAKLGGISTDHRLDITGDDKGNRQVPFVGHLFSPNGRGVDDMATQLGQYGFLTDEELNDVDGGVQALRDKIRDEFDGVQSHYSSMGEQERQANERDEAGLAEAEREQVVEYTEEIIDETAAVVADSNWSTMTEDEQNAEIDAAFGGENPEALAPSEEGAAQPRTPPAEPDRQAEVTDQTPADAGVSDSDQPDTVTAEGPVADAIDQQIAAAESAGISLTEDDKNNIRAALERASDLRTKANRISGAASDPLNKGTAFPLGVGFTRETKRSNQRIDASVRRAGEAVAVFNKASSAQNYAKSLLAGKGTEADNLRKAAKREDMQRGLVRRLVEWKRGDKIGQFTIDRVNLDRDGYPATYTISGDGIVKGVGDKVDVAREFFDGDKTKFRGMVDDAKSTPPLELTGESPTDLAAKAQQEAAQKMTEAAQALKDTADAMRESFALTGSARAADVGAAAGQGNLLDQPTTDQANEPAAETKETDAGTAMFSRQTPDALRQYTGRSGRPVFENESIALVRPKRGAVDGNYAYWLYDAALVRQGRPEPESRVGMVELDVSPDGTITGLNGLWINNDLRTQRRDQQKQSRKGYGEKVVRAILATLPDGAELKIFGVVPNARGFWEKMGIEYDDTGRLLDNGYITRGAYERQRGKIGGGDSSLVFARRGGSETSAVGVGEGRDRRGLQDDGPDPVRGFRSPTSPANAGLSVGALEKALRPALDQWSNAPDVVILPSIEQAPAAIRDADASQKSQGATGEVEGVWWNGKVYLIADQLHSVDRAQTVLAHEVLGHYGLRGAFGGEFNAILTHLANSRRSDVDRKAREYGLDPKNESDRLIAAEEVLAELAQTQPKSTWVRRAIAAIKKFLRDLGLNIPVSDSDIVADYILPARAFVERGGQVDSGPAMASRQSPIWYSQFERFIEDKAPNSATAQQWGQTLDAWAKQGKFKADELEWSGVKEWLRLHEPHNQVPFGAAPGYVPAPMKITKQEVLGFIAQNGVKVEETMLGGRQLGGTDSIVNDAKVKLDALGWDVGDFTENEMDGTFSLSYLVRRSDGEEFDGDAIFTGDTDAPEAVREQVGRIAAALADANVEYDEDGTKYAQFTLPGGENYRELLLTLPEKNRPDEASMQAFFADYRGRHPNASDTTLMQKWAENRGIDTAGQFKSSHWSQPNILAHIRFNERTDAEGKRVLFIEEIQSDWAQKGKKEGFGWQGKIVRDPDGKWGIEYKNGERDSGYSTKEDAERALRDYGRDAGIPSAPFVQKTEAWVSLALKRMIRYAAENGFDRVAMVTGQQSADRYDLSKRIGEVRAQKVPSGLWHIEADDPAGGAIIGKDVQESDLQDVVGKELADKIIKKDGGTFSGLDLKVGGEGMITFYDRIVPNVANDLLKKLGGGRVTNVGIQTKEGQFADTDADQLSVIDNDDGTFSLMDPESGEYQAKNVTRAEAERMLSQNQVTTPQPGFDITPAMRQSAMSGMPMFSRSAATTKAHDFVHDLLTTDKRFGFWHRTIGTQQHKALINKDFKAVYDEAQRFISDSSRYANESADLAADLMPRIDSLKDFFKKAPSKEAVNKAGNALMQGTLFGGGSPLQGRLWTQEELKTGRLEGKGLQMFEPLNDAEIKLYRQALAAANHSLDEFAKSMVYRYAKTHGIAFDRDMSLDDVVAVVNESLDAEISDRALKIEGLQPMLAEAEENADADYDHKNPDARMQHDRAVTKRNELRKQVETAEKESAEFEATKAAIADVAEKTAQLQDHGYFPAMRFGRHAVYVTRTDPKTKAVEQLHFSLYDSQLEANRAARDLAKEYPGADITKGLVSQERHKLFQGLSLDALETFAEHMAIDADPIIQGFLRAATSQRSTLKRQIHRTGLAGFTDDIPRALASFVVSTARTTSSNYHSANMLSAANDIKAGDVQDEAVKLVRYLMDPQEEAAGLRGFLFFNFIGGSIAHGMVNMTQPVMVTAPYLSQHTSYANAVTQLAKAMKEISRGAPLPQGIAAAMRRARQEGIVAPQEIHQLRAEAGPSIAGKSLFLRKMTHLWGAIYSVTESFNRESTFIAAYRIGQENKVSDPYQFAVDAVNETQFVYNKGSRGNWGRGTVGATVMTFKQFSISYIELMKRLYDKDKKAFAIMVLTLLAAAGAEGLPFAEDIEDIIDTIGQWMGYATNSKKAMRQFATDILGKDMANFALRGVSAGLPIDVSVRLGLQNLIPGTAMLNPSAKNKTGDVAEILGPVGQFLPVEGTSLGRAIDRLTKGDIFGAAKSGAPVAIKNFLSGYEMLETGEARDTAGRKITEVGTGSGLSKMIGLQPAALAESSRRIGEVYDDIAMQRAKESEIADKWARGIHEKDPAVVDSARKQLLDWNTKNPELKIRITAQQLQSRVRQMKMSRDDRFVKRAPPEIRRQVIERMTP